MQLGQLYLGSAGISVSRLCPHRVLRASTLVQHVSMSTVGSPLAASASSQQQRHFTTITRRNAAPKKKTTKRSQSQSQPIMTGAGSASKRQRRPPATGSDQPAVVGGAPPTDVVKPAVTLSLQDIMREWKEVSERQHADDSLKGVAEQGIAAAGSSTVTPSSPASSPPPHNAQQSGIFAVVQKNPNVYPSLYALCYSEELNAVEASRTLAVEGAEALVASEQNTVYFLSFLRAYRQQPRHAQHVDVMMASVMLAFTSVWRTAATSHKAAYEVKRSMVLLLLEQHRGHFGLSAAGKDDEPAAGDGKSTDGSTPTKATTTSKRRSPRKKESEVQMWNQWKHTTSNFMREGVLPMVQDISSGSSAQLSTANTVSELLTDYIILCLSSELDMVLSVAEQPWRATAKNVVVEAMQAKMEALGAAYFQKADVSACEAAITDVFTALKLAMDTDTVLPQKQSIFIRTHATRCVKELCKATHSRLELFHCLCSENVALRVEQLKRAPGTLYAQVCTDVFTAAAVYMNTTEGVASMDTLLDEKEKMWRSGLAVTDVEKLPPRPVFHGTASRMCYVLMCVGYSPEAILSSGLCLSISAVELTDITATASLFSMSFALGPLPVRVRSVLADRIDAIAGQCLYDMRRVVSSPTDMMEREGDAMHLASRVERGGSVLINNALISKSHAASAEQNRKKKKKWPKKKKEEAITAVSSDTNLSAMGAISAENLSTLMDQAFYLGLNFVTECLLRGDDALASRTLLSLFPLLDFEGSAAYLVEAIEYITSNFGKRLATAGSLEKFKVPLKTTTLPMEKSLMEMSNLFLTRLAENISHRLNKKKSTSSSSSLSSSSVHRLSTSEQDVFPASRAEVDELLLLFLRFTVSSLVSGLRLTAVQQLTSLHTALLKAKGPIGGSSSSNAASGDDGAREAFLVVERLDRLMTQLNNNKFCVPRHPQSGRARSGSIALNGVVAAHLHSTAVAAAALNAVPKHIGGGTSKRQRNYVLSVAHLLFRLSSDHPVEAEPPSLRSFRTDILDPALTFVLGDATISTADLGLTTLTEVAVVMCVPLTIHHVSAGLYKGLASRVVAHMKDRKRESAPGSAAAARDTFTGALSQRLLCAAAIICLRSDEALTAEFVTMLSVLEKTLSVNQTVIVLEHLLQRKVPTDAAPVSLMLSRLVSALQAFCTTARATLTSTEAINILRILSQYDRAEGCHLEVPYGPALMRLCRPGTIQRRRLADCGALVHVAASVGPAALRRCSAEEREFLVLIPRQLAVTVLQAPQTGTERDIPAVLTGYAAVTDNAIRTQVLRAFISRTIRASTSMAPEEVVLCVEAYCRAEIYNDYLFSVLLGRVADATQKFTLDQSLRLLCCGTNSGNQQVRLACLTAARPVFVAHVRHVLQSDPDMLSTVGSASMMILGCLRDCFPTDAICSTVLENISQHHHCAGTTVTKAALDLIAARGSQDYNVLRVLADHTASQLLPSSTPRDLADLTYLLVSCGVRSGAIQIASNARFVQVVKEADGYVLARLAAARHLACVDTDTEVLQLTTGRVLDLVEGFISAGESVATTTTRSAPPCFTAQQAAALLQYFQAASTPHLALVMEGVDALLTHLWHMWKTPRSSSSNAADDALSSECTIASLKPNEIETILRCCVEVASHPKDHKDLVRYCATYIHDALRTPPAAHPTTAADMSSAAAAAAAVVVSATTTPVPAWRSDLLLLANTCNYLVRMGESSHPAVKAILDLLYEKRSIMIKRHLVLETTRTALAGVDRSVHPELFGLVMAGGNGRL